jgi:tetratricopeptide (TPR) repeat protein
MLLIRAEILASLGSPDLALSDLDRRISTGAPSARAHSLRARLREQFGNDAGALQDARTALRLAPGPERALRAARLLSTAQGPRAAGSLCVEAANALGGAVTLRLAAVDYFAAAGHPDLALTQVSALLAASPQHPDWLVLSADLLDEAGRPKDAQSRRLRALARLDEALAIRPTPARQAARARLAAQLAELP